MKEKSDSGRTIDPAMATNVVLDTTMVRQTLVVLQGLTDSPQGSITLELYNNHAPKVRKLHTAVPSPSAILLMPRGADPLSSRPATTSPPSPNAATTTTSSSTA